MYCWMSVVYQLSPPSWKPDASLPQTVSEVDVEQTCKLSHDLLLSEILPSTDDADQLLKPAADQTTSSSLSEISSTNNEQADLLSTEPVPSTDDVSSARRSKLSWSGSGGIKQTVADEDDFEYVMLLSAVIWCGLSIYSVCIYI